MRWAAALALALLSLADFYHRQRLEFVPAAIVLPADGAEHQAMQVRAPRFGFDIPATEDARLRLLESRNAAGRTVLDGLIQSPVMPGRDRVSLRWRGHAVSVPVTFVFDANDSYGEGTPDFLRLHTAQDRSAFRAWFSSIAQSQADLPAERLPSEIDDCAALLRFAYREALRAHDEAWLKAWLSTHPTETPRPSVRQYVYPQTPLRANLFRVRPGPFLGEDLSNGAFAQFADAQTLMRDNTYLVGRAIELARPGDLIFYRQLEQNSPYDVSGNHGSYHSPFHSMIVCADDAVVYHTGPIHAAGGARGRGQGEMRRLLLTDLSHYPDARWRPVSGNENFLGVYRWNILREGD